ncbi:MAG: NAD(P)-dependent oxidoreductase [Rhodospirillales bacterium]|nr:NAD(P)-dependent oxidoreductase [Rhodospirillales bacterium]
MLAHNFSSPQNPSRVVILGAKGFVGTTLGKKLRKNNIEILDLGRGELDLLAPDASEKLANLLSTEDSLVVISAEAPVKNNAMLERNISMMSSVCAALEKISPAHVVYVSSDAVYADSEGPLSETSNAQPASLHGVMHLAREVMLSNAYSGPLAFVRPTLIYGVDDPHNGYGPNRFRRLAQKGQEIVLFGEGEERRDHVLVEDVAELVSGILMQQSQGILNVATGQVKSFKEIAEMVVSHFGDSPKIKGSPRVGEMPHNGYRPFDPAQTFKAFPGFSYTQLDEGLLKVHKALVEKN